MIVLDTNVVSEPLKPAPNAAVLEWIDLQAPETLFLTAISLAEMLAGFATMPAGRRQSQLRDALTERVLPLFGPRILVFDQAAADAFAHVNAHAQAAGNRIGFADGAIAAIASAHGFMLATRNERDFRSTGVALFNPWSTTSR